MLTRKQRKNIDGFIIRLVVMKAEAGRLGLLRTMHEMDKATKMVGWEFVDLIEGKQKTAQLPRGIGTIKP